MKLRVYAVENIRNRQGQIDKKRYWRLSLGPEQVKRLDNGALISCGLTFYGGEYPGSPDELPATRLHRLYNKAEVTEQEYKHSGCQSKCTLRGDLKCQW